MAVPHLQQVGAIRPTGPRRVSDASLPGRWPANQGTRYAQEILAQTDESVEQVSIEPNGNWTVPGGKVAASAATPSQEASLVDDDDIVVSEVSKVGGGRASLSTPHLATPTSAASRDTSSAPRSSNKRPVEVIDLTLSDDDDVPARPVKRANYGSGFPGFQT